MKPEAETLN